jgi:hypothetical protein
MYNNEKIKKIKNGSCILNKDTIYKFFNFESANSLESYYS